MHGGAAMTFAELAARHGMSEDEAIRLMVLDPYVPPGPLPAAPAPPTDSAEYWMYEFRLPRFRYFRGADDHWYFWTTERVPASERRFADRYVSGAMKPTGPGARSGNAQEWELVPDSVSASALRKDAKGRAGRLHDKAQKGERTPWR